MKTTEHLKEELSQGLDDFKAKKIGSIHLKTIAYTVGKFVYLLRTEIEYQKHRGTNNSIDNFGDSNGTN